MCSFETSPPASAPALTACARCVALTPCAGACARPPRQPAPAASPPLLSRRLADRLLPSGAPGSRAAASRPRTLPQAAYTAGAAARPASPLPGPRTAGRPRPARSPRADQASRLRLQRPRARPPPRRGAGRLACSAPSHAPPGRRRRWPGRPAPARCGRAAATRSWQGVARWRWAPARYAARTRPPRAVCSARTSTRAGGCRCWRGPPGSGAPGARRRLHQDGHLGHIGRRFTLHWELWMTSQHCIFPHVAITSQCMQGTAQKVLNNSA